MSLERAASSIDAGDASSASPGENTALVLLIGALSGLALAINGVRPTGSGWVDTALMMAALAAATWAAVHAGDWAIAGAAVVATGMASSVANITIGVAVTAWSIWRARSSSTPSDPERAVLIGGIAVIMSTAGERGPFGLTAAIGLTTFAVLIVLGLIRARPISGLARRMMLSAAIVLAAATVGLVIAVWAASGSLRHGTEAARAGLDALREGDLDAAGPAFSDASAEFTAAERSLTRPWAQLAAVLPIGAQHQRSAARLSGAAATTSETIAAALEQVDLEAIEISDGAIPIDAIVELGEPLTAAQDAVDRLRHEVGQADGAWIIAPVSDRLQRLDADLADQQRVGRIALGAVEVAPDLLGGNGRRTYFVMFTTPGEARGQGGFMANYAILTMADGTFSIGDVGRTSDLNEAGARPRRISGPEDWLARYGPYGFADPPDGAVGAEPWSNITMSPYFPSTATVVAELYPQSGGSSIDGVISLDVYALERIVDVVGPIHVDGSDEPLTGTNVAEFLLIDQYEDASADRIDLLGTIAERTIDGLLTEGIDPFEFGSALVPMAEQRRLLAWSRHEAEQALLNEAELDGTLFDDIDLEADAAFSVRAVNGSASKIDTYLERQICVHRDGAVVRLTNHAPAEGLPDYVIGNRVGLPTGTSRLLISWHSTLAVSSVRLDGKPVGLIAQREQDAWAYTVLLDLPAEDSAELEIEFERSLTDPQIADGIYASPQPLVIPERWELVDTAGDPGCTPGENAHHLTPGRITVTTTR